MTKLDKEAISHNCKRSYFYPYKAMLDTCMFNPNLKAILNGKECPILLHHLKNASKALATIFSIQELSCPSPGNIFVILGNHELKFRHFMKVQRFTEILQETTVQNSFQQMQTVIDLNSSAI